MNLETFEPLIPPDNIQRRTDMDQPVSRPLTLAQLAVGASALITEIKGGRELHRKLSGLGIRVGTRVCVEHRRGTGLVVSAGSTRIALGGGIVDKLCIDRLDEEQVQR